MGEIPTLTLISDDFVKKYECEDWGQNKDGWHAKVLDVNGFLTVAMLPPDGKIWRAKLLPESTEA